MSSVTGFGDLASSKGISRGNNVNGLDRQPSTTALIEGISGAVATLCGEINSATSPDQIDSLAQAIWHCWGRGELEDVEATLFAAALENRRPLRHPGHPVLDMCVANAVTVSDPTGARKLVKERATGRIDGLVVATTTIGAAVKIAPKKESVYKMRGLVSVKVA